MAALKDLLARLSRPPEDRRAEELRAWVVGFPNVTPIGDLTPRQRCRVAGIVRNIRIDPTEGRSVEATITDGTGKLIVRWLGRSSLQGVKLGGGMVVEGTASQPSAGVLTVLNPEYELVPGPEQS